MKIKFLTFADGSPSVVQAGYRISRQASKTAWFDEVILASYKTLGDLDPLWAKHHHGFVHEFSRGFGNWIWKPKLIFETLRQCSAGDLVVYCDAGYEISPKGKVRALQYCDMARVSGFVAFKLSQKIGNYTKKETLERFGLYGDHPLCAAEQHQAGLLIISYSELMVEFFHYWSRVCCEQNGRYLSDKLSNGGEHEEFVDHRHDQSILSLLMLGFNFYCSLPIEDFFPEMWLAGMYPSQYPFHAMRNKSGIQRIA